MMKACPDFEETGHAPMQNSVAGGGLSDPREDFEESGFTCPVAANDPQNLAFLHLERNIAEGPEVAIGGDVLLAMAYALPEPLHIVSQTRHANLPQAVALGETMGGDDG